MSIIIRLQNLPWSANSLDIRRFFSGLSIPEGGVHIVGGEMGDAFIAFSTDEDARLAMEKDGGKIKDMQIKLLLSSRTEMMRVIEQARQQNMVITQPQMIVPPTPILSLQPQPGRIMAPTSEPEQRRGHSPSPHHLVRDRSPIRDHRHNAGERHISKRERSESPSRNNRGLSRDMDRRSDRFKRDDRHYDDSHYRDDRHSERDPIQESKRYPDADNVNSKSQLHATEGFRNMAPYEQINAGLYPYLNLQTAKGFQESYTSTSANLPSRLPQTEQITSHKPQDFQSVRDQKYPLPSAYPHDSSSYHGLISESTRKDNSISSEQPMSKIRRRTRFEPEFGPTSVSSHFPANDSKPILQNQQETSYNDMRNMPRNYQDRHTWPQEPIDRTRTWDEKQENLLNPSVPKSKDFLQMDVDQSPSDISTQKEKYHETLPHGRGPQGPILNDVPTRNIDPRRDNRGFPIPVDKGHPNQDRGPISHDENRKTPIKDREPVTHSEKEVLSLQDRESLSRGTNRSLSHQERGPVLHGENRTLAMQDRGPMSHGENRTLAMQDRGPMSHGENRTLAMQDRGPMSHGENRTLAMQDRGPMSHGENRTLPMQDRRTMPHGDNRPLSMQDRGPMSHGENRALLMQERGSMSHGENRIHSMQDKRQMTHDENRGFLMKDRGPLSLNENREHPMHGRGPMTHSENRNHPMQDKGQVPHGERGPMAHDENRTQPMQDRGKMSHNEREPMTHGENRAHPMQDRGQTPQNERGPITHGENRTSPMQDKRQTSHNESKSLSVQDRGPRSHGENRRSPARDRGPTSHIDGRGQPMHNDSPARIPPSLTVEIRGLPPDARIEDILDLFHGIPLPAANIRIEANDLGLEKAFIRFVSVADFEEALRRNRQFINEGRCELIPCAAAAFDSAPRSQKPRPKLKPRDEDLVVQLRGLPFSCKEEDIVNFFDGLGILDLFIEIAPDGRASGIGFVEFGKPEDFRAALAMNGKMIGPRYITVSIASKEMMAFARGEDFDSGHSEPRFANSGRPSNSVVNQSRPPPNHVRPPGPQINQGRQATPPIQNRPPPCISMKGLPEGVTNRDIVDFLGQMNVMPRAVHIMLRPDKTPSGDAFAEFGLPTDIDAALQLDGNLMRGSCVSIQPISFQEMSEILGRPSLMPPPPTPPALLKTPGDIERPHRPLPVDVDRPRRSAPGDERPRGPLLPQGPNERAFRERSRMEPSVRPFGPGRMRAPWPNRPYNRPEGRFPPPPPERGLQDFGAPGCVVSINNLHFKAGLEELLDFFRDYRITKDSIRRKYNDKGLTTGEARIAFQNPRDAQRAVRELNNKPIMGRSLILSIL